MTRINATINPKDLTDKHLLAEHREIKRIPNMVKSGKAVVENIPEQFTLGKGHVKFFYNKLEWLYRRYEKIYDECISRGFNVASYHNAWVWSNQQERELITKNWNDWPMGMDEWKRVNALITERINQRLQGVK